MKIKLTILLCLFLISIWEMRCNHPYERTGCAAGKYVGIHCGNIIIQISDAGHGGEWKGDDGKIYRNCVAASRNLGFSMPADSVIYLGFVEKPSLQADFGTCFPDSFPFVQITYLSYQPCISLANVDVPLSNNVPVTNQQPGSVSRNGPPVKL